MLCGRLLENVPASRCDPWAERNWVRTAPGRCKRESPVRIPTSPGRRSHDANDYRKDQLHSSLKLVKSVRRGPPELGAWRSRAAAQQPLRLRGGDGYMAAYILVRMGGTNAPLLAPPFCLFQVPENSPSMVPMPADLGQVHLQGPVKSRKVGVPRERKMRETHPESYITKSTRIRRLKVFYGQPNFTSVGLVF